MIPKSTLSHNNGSPKPQNDVVLLSPKAKFKHRRNSMYAILSMVLLTVQGTTMSIVLRFSRINKVSGKTYIPSVAVCIAEVIKLAICIIVHLVERRSSPTQQFLPTTASPTSSTASTTSPSFRTSTAFKQRMILAFKDALPMSIPAGMFVFQQILLIWAATFLDAVSYQIFNQSFKLVPTAVFAYLLLHQQLKPIQWASMPVLAAGVVFVTLNNAPSTDDKASLQVSRSNWLLGMAACSISGLSSAYAGVYFEKYLKGKHAGSLIHRNIQLGVFGAPLSIAYAWFKDGAILQKDGWLQGFGGAAWGVVVLQVFGGLVIGMVVKYCDNVLKNFSLAVSVIMTVLVAIPLFGQWPSPFFLVGVVLVLLSVFMYSESTWMVLDMKKVGKYVYDVVGKRKIFSSRGVVLGSVCAMVVCVVVLLNWQAVQRQQEYLLIRNTAAE